VFLLLFLLDPRFKILPILEPGVFGYKIPANPNAGALHQRIVGAVGIFVYQCSRLLTLVYPVNNLFTLCLFHLLELRETGGSAYVMEIHRRFLGGGWQGGMGGGWGGAR